MLIFRGVHFIFSEGKTGAERSFYPLIPSLGTCEKCSFLIGFVEIHPGNLADIAPEHRPFHPKGKDGLPNHPFFRGYVKCNLPRMF